MHLTLHRAALSPLALGLAAALLLVGVELVAESRTRSDALAQERHVTRASADAAARALVRQRSDWASTIEAAATSPALAAALTRRTPEAFDEARQELRVLAAGKRAPAAFLSDAQGRIVVIAPDQPELLGVSFAFRDWYQGAAKLRRTYVSSAYASAAQGNPLVVGIATPVHERGGRLLGYLTSLWELRSVRDVVSGTQRDEGTRLTITDQRGAALADTLPLLDRGEVATPDPTPETRAALAGKRTTHVRDGQVVATVPVPDLGWTVSASRPEGGAAAAAATSLRHLRTSLALALVLVATLTALALRVARRQERERQRAEQERARLDALLAAAPIGIMEGLPDGTILAVNPAMAELLGYTPDELLATSSHALADPSSVPGIAGSMQAVLEGRLSSYTAERHYRHKDGTPVPVSVSVVATRDPDGAVRRLVALVVDLREERRREAELRALAHSLEERQAFLDALIDAIDASVIACDARGRVTRVNRALRTSHGIPDDEPIQDLSSFELRRLDGSRLPAEEAPLRRALQEERVPDTELLVVPRGGRPPARMLTRATALRTSDGQVTGAVVVGLDVTALRAAEDALRRSEERFRTVFDEGLVGKAVVSRTGVVVRANRAFAALVEREAASLTGTDVAQLLAEEEDRRQLRSLLRHHSGGSTRTPVPLDRPADREPVWVQLSVVGLSPTDEQQERLLQLEDITLRLRAEQRLSHLALHDELTGLPNRRVLVEQCERALAVARSERGSSTVTLLFLDLDGFKQVNDRAGHARGDALLREVAHDLRATLRPADLLARVGGDEFVVLLGSDEGSERIRGITERLRSSVRRHVPLDDAGDAVTGVDVSVSIGVARVDLRDEPDTTPEQLLRRADRAMFRAKERGRDRYEVYDAELHASTEARQGLERSVRAALSDGRVDLVYQPVVDVDTDVVVGAEALLRLRGEDGRPLPTLPAVLAAESAGLADALGDEVLRRALATASRWPAHMSVAVNTSARELNGRDFRHRVETALRRSGLEPGRLVLEITESSILRADPSTLGELEALRQLGVKVAIDDFGTSYATLHNLTVLPVDVLKVDATFTAGLPSSRKHTAVVHGVVSMAFELGIPCVVEGVERAEQVELLRGLSVQAQGWLWGQPHGADWVPPATVPAPRRGTDPGG